MPVPNILHPNYRIRENYSWKPFTSNNEEKQGKALEKDYSDFHHPSIARCLNENHGSIWYSISQLHYDFGIQNDNHYSRCEVYLDDQIFCRASQTTLKKERKMGDDHSSHEHLDTGNFRIDINSHNLRSLLRRCGAGVQDFNDNWHLLHHWSTHWALYCAIIDRFLPSFGFKKEGNAPKRG
jgi:hypothetical protein